MKVCPKCGYRQPDEWQPSRFRAEVEFCRIEDFKRLYPNLAPEMQKEIFTDETFAYLTRKSGVIERIPLDLFKNGGRSAFSIPREKYYHKDPFQKKLSELKPTQE